MKEKTLKIDEIVLFQLRKNYREHENNETFWVFAKNNDSNCSSNK